MTPKPKRKPWWAIARSDVRARKTYHYLNVAGKRDRAICVTTAALDAGGTGAFAMCINCKSNTCEHAVFVAECVTMGVATIGEERHRDSAPPPSDAPVDIEHFHGATDDESNCW